MAQYAQHLHAVLRAWSCEVLIERYDVFRRGFARMRARVGAPALNHVAGGSAGAIAVAIVGVDRPAQDGLGVVYRSGRRGQLGAHVRREL